MELFDSHAHLDDPRFTEDLPQVLERAAAADVTRIVTIGAGYGRAAAPRAIALAEQYAGVWASVGVHPHDAAPPFDSGWLTELARHPRVVAIGETGLDFYRNLAAPADQERWFRTQIELAGAVGKPLVIHSRAAAPRCLEILRELEAEKIGGVFHCYAEDAAFALELAELNFKVSIPGTVTFKNADRVRSAVRQIPLAQILVETDAPYLAPVPYRGQRCESAFVLETVKAIAALKGLSVADTAAATTANALALYHLALGAR